MKSTHLEDMISKYNAGDRVVAKENPALTLRVSRYTNQIYYCKVLDDSVEKQLVYFERDLLPFEEA